MKLNVLIPVWSPVKKLCCGGKFEDGGMTLSNDEIIKNIEFYDNTDKTLGRYDFSFSTTDKHGAEMYDYDGYIIESALSSRRNDEIEWGSNAPEDWENAEKILLNAFTEYKYNLLNKKNDGGTTHKYKLGDEWGKDFDYDGMIQQGLKTNENWSIEDLKKLAESMTDVNYHTEARPLYKAISFLEEGDMNNARKELKEFHKLLKDIDAFEHGGIAEGKNIYKAFYKGKNIEVKADTSYDAQKKAAAQFKAKKSYDISVVLLSKGDEEVIHDTSEFAKGGRISIKDEDIDIGRRFGFPNGEILEIIDTYIEKHSNPIDNESIVVFTRTSDKEVKKHQNTRKNLKLFLKNWKAQLINKHTEEILGEKYWTKYAKGGETEKLEKELRKLQRELNSHRLLTYRLGDNSNAEKERKKEREIKEARFDEILKVLNENKKFAKGGKTKTPTNKEVVDNGDLIDSMPSDVGGSNESQDLIMEYNGVKYIVTTDWDNEPLQPNDKASIYEDEFAKGGQPETMQHHGKTIYVFKTSLDEPIINGIRDFFVSKNYRVDKKMWDDTISATKDVYPNYYRNFLKEWNEYKEIADIQVEKGDYIVPFMVD